MRKRAELSDGREQQMRERHAEERTHLLHEIEGAKTLRRGLEAQVGAMRAERRNHVIGYCAEMARLDTTPKGYLSERKRLNGAGRQSL